MEGRLEGGFGESVISPECRVTYEEQPKKVKPGPKKTLGRSFPIECNGTSTRPFQKG